MELFRLLGPFEEEAIEDSIGHHRPKYQNQIEGEDDRHKGADDGQHLKGKQGHRQPKNQGTPTDMSIDFILFHTAT